MIKAWSCLFPLMLVTRAAALVFDIALLAGSPLPRWTDLARE